MQKSTFFKIMQENLGESNVCRKEETLKTAKIPPFSIGSSNYTSKVENMLHSQDLHHHLSPCSYPHQWLPRMKARENAALLPKMGLYEWSFKNHYNFK